MPSMPRHSRHSRRRTSPIKKRNQSFYNNRKWRNASTAYRMQNPLCEVCASVGDTVAATVCDHIVRIEDGGAPYDHRNHMAMCALCHDKKRGKEAHGFMVDTIETDDGLIPRRRLEVIEALT